jgi:hypothetical protein
MGPRGDKAFSSDQIWMFIPSISIKAVVTIQGPPYNLLLRGTPQRKCDFSNFFNYNFSEFIIC